MKTVLEQIQAERIRQIEVCKHGGDTIEFDKTNSRNDWIAYVIAYLGRASDKVFRNEKQGERFYENMVKAAALIVAALEAENNKSDSN